MTNSVKTWLTSALLAALITGVLALITNITGISFFKVVVIGLLIMVFNRTGYTK